MLPNSASASERGIGVAVSESASTASPLASSLARCSTPKRCCSSMMARLQRTGATSSSSSACVPISTASAPDAHAASSSSRSATGVEPVSTPQVIPAASSHGPRLSPCWRASTSVGAMSSAWVRVSATDASANAATAVLPVPTSPRSMWFIACSEAIPARIASLAAA